MFITCISIINMECLIKVFLDYSYQQYANFHYFKTLKNQSLNFYVISPVVNSSTSRLWITFMMPWKDTIDFFIKLIFYRKKTSIQRCTQLQRRYQGSIHKSNRPRYPIFHINT